jgi:hypothetical protein
MIPAFDADGNLPAGIHWAEWAEIVARFGGTAHRQRLLSGLHRALQQFKSSGCRVLYLDGSFVTAKEHPNDYDACYDVIGVDPFALDRDFFDFSDFQAARVRQKATYFGEFFPAQAREGGTGRTFVEFFQEDKDTGAARGIIALDLRSWQS